MTNAFDVTTILHALQTLEKEFLGENREWRADLNVDQGRLFEIYFAYKDIIDQVRDLKAKASTDWEVLNAFLASEKFDPMFDRPLDGIGVVSILDKFVKWVVEGTFCEILSAGKTYPGFELEKGNFLAYDVKHSEHPLVELVTLSDDRLFLIMNERSLSGLDLFDFAVETMSRKGGVLHSYSGVQLPKIDFDVKPDIDFLRGANTIDSDDGRWYIAQAFQQFKFRMDEKGARAKVATGLGMEKCISFEPLKDLIFDKPFVGWFMQKDLKVPLPIAVFYADRDSWKEPEGELGDL